MCVNKIRNANKVIVEYKLEDALGTVITMAPKTLAYLWDKNLIVVKNLKRGTLGNKGRHLDVCTKVYGQYPMFSMSVEYVEWYRQELYRRTLI